MRTLFLLCFILSRACWAVVLIDGQPAAQVSAGDCASVDFSRDLGPTRDQGNTGWCAAYSSADLLTQALRREGVNIKGLGTAETGSDVSAALLVNPGIARETSSLLETSTGMVVAETLEAALRRGRICTEDQLPFNRGRLSQGFASIDDESYERSQELQRNFPRIGSRSRQRNAAGETVSIERMLKCERQLDSRFEVKNLVSHARANRINTDSAENARYRHRIDEALNAGRIASVSYRSGFLTGTDPTLNTNHASTIVGRKRMNGKCHYLLRNTWGPTCHQYVSPYKERCRNGTVWINQEDLIKHVYGVTYLPPSSESQRSSSPSRSENSLRQRTGGER